MRLVRRALVPLSALLAIPGLVSAGPSPLPPPPNVSDAHATAPRPGAPRAPAGTLAFTRLTLANGMRVILHEDHSAPTVVVNAQVDVGSRDDPEGRSGFAHLFEHMMFMGTKRVPEGAFDSWMEATGGSNNATTSEDLTNYFDVGPSPSLPLLLWLEADRFREIGPLLTDKKLNLQRDVVRKERQQTTENKPYRVAELKLPTLLFPKGHPYHHPVIGSHEDLVAASLSDAQAFFAKWYDPSNVVLVVAGDFRPEEVLPRVHSWMGSIPSRGRPNKPAREPFTETAAAIKRVIRADVDDNVPFPKTVMAWVTPPKYHKDDATLSLVADLAAGGRASRLYRTLVTDKKLAREVSASQESGALVSRFVVTAIPADKVSLDTLEAAIDRELAELRSSPVSARELGRVKTQFETALVSRLQSLPFRAELLATYETEAGDAGYLPTYIRAIEGVTPTTLREAAARWLPKDRRVILRVLPRKEAAK